MPLPNFPPTPASSTELVAQDKLHRPSLDNGFALPPPAMQDHIEAETHSTSISSHSTASVSSPEQKTRARRASTSKGSGQSLTLPPPPSRSRKIIQMKPKSAQQIPLPESTSSTPSKAKPEPIPVAGTKRKAASSTSVAGRKIARKTAHSLIERRRRSKMNEEFATLKDMVPACRGHEMHKLAILQASIDYLRYLQDCIGDLKEAANGRPEDRSPPRQTPTSPAFSPLSSSVMSTPYLSPAVGPQPHPLSRTQSASKDDKRGNILSPLGSAEDRPQRKSGRPQSENAESPLMTPEDDMDLDEDQNEATTALLMLNRDRRGTGPSPLLGPQSPSLDQKGEEMLRVNSKSSSKGMSVLELLSS